MMIRLGFLAALFSYGLALYTPRDDIVLLTEANFDSLVTGDDSVWIVEFFAPWCGHCKSLAPEYKKAGTALKGVVKVGAVDCDENAQLAQRFNVRGFPTIKVFEFPKGKPEEYNGGRTAKDIVEAGLKAAKSKVYAQLGGKKSSGDEKAGDPKDVVELTDSNFDELVLRSKDMWLVEFFAPWCGHCKNLAPHWAKAATELKGKVKLGALDATVNTIKAREYNINSYPTIKFFGSGKKDGSYEDYNGGRTSGDIVTWAMDKLAENVPAPELVELTSPTVLKDACEEHPLCVISVLPHILDCQSQCRNQYLGILKKEGEEFKKKMWGWGWAEAGSQPELEEVLDIGGFGYPAMAVMNTKKMKYSIFKGSFSEDGIHEFLRDLSFGRGSTAPVKGASLPKVHETEPWDGKDKELPPEEDIDLSDVELDDLKEEL